MKTADRDDWVDIGTIAKRLAARLIEQRLAAARQGPAPAPAANDNADQGQVHKFTTTARNPCSVGTSP